MSRLSANSSAAAGASPTAANAEAAAAGGGFTGVGLDLSNSHGHGTRSNASKCSNRHHHHQQRVQQQRNGLCLDVGLDLQQDEQMHVDGSCGTTQQSQQKQSKGQRQQQQHVLSHQNGLQYYADEGSPPNVHTHILEEAEDEDALHSQVPLKEVGTTLAVQVTAAEAVCKGTAACAGAVIYC